ncbi:phosphatase PAP2 family protein [Trinickia fusca]|uniref:Phosphatase PAP2 family protein n=1 Tax=Trinickia fusca TaxID=2419777 RepID=A0A494XHS1_9BURK|nr:phosphatase PAP2 family protein [Trinickia fusca]RKP48146.1 phosphatase PAP2 family protein [Trinickia fusca]
MQKIEALNQALFLTMNATPLTPTWLIRTASFIANDLIWLIPLALIGMWLTGGDRRRELAIRSCLVTAIALGLNQLIGLVWQHPRPFMIGLGHTFLQHAPDSSFPSDHGTIFAAVTLTLLVGGMKRLGGAALIVGLAVAWARVFLGVHFPLDMLGAVAVVCLIYGVLAPLWTLSGQAVTRLVVSLYRALLAHPIRSGWLRP